MDAHFVFFTLLLSALAGRGSGDDGWSMTVQAEVRAMEGYPVVLPCSFSHPHHTQHSALTVLWRLGHGRDAAPLFSCTTRNAAQTCEPGPRQDHRYRLEGNPREHDLSLRINSANLQDSGRYYCRVEVPGKQHAGYEDKMGTRLRVEAAPRILGLSVEGGDEAGFSAVCEVLGSPLPDLQWLSPDRVLEGDVSAPSAQDSAGRHHALSRLRGVLPGQDYTCSATNPLGRDQATLYVVPGPAVGEAPPLLVLLSVSLGAKALLLLGLGAWVVRWCAGCGLSCPRK